MDDVTRQVMLLYELSLSTLKYLDPFDTCKHFITKFLSRKALNYGAIWMGDLDQITEESIFQKLYALPDQVEFATIKKSELNELKKTKQIIIKNYSIFNEVKIPGYFSYYILKDVGILELNTKKSPEKINKLKLQPFQDVFDQLAFSIKSGFSYMMLQEEVKQRKEAQKSLTINELKYKNIINNIQLGLLEVDHDETIRHANESFLELMGYELDEVLGKKATDLFLYDVSDQTLNNQTRLRMSNMSSTYEIKLKDKHGNQKWAIVSGSPNYDQTGKLIGSIGINLDITKQKELEAENEFKSLQLKILYEMSLDALITVDEEGKIYDWSHQATEVFGYTKAETIGENVLRKLTPNRHWQAHEQVAVNYLKTGKGPLLNTRMEATAINKDGKEFQIEYTVVHMEYKGRHYFNAVLRDITTLKTTRVNMERALKRQRELNDMKSQFISTTSHELRTPLTTIKSNTDIIKYQLNIDDPIDREMIIKNVDRIEGNAGRLNQLINNILMIGRLDSRKTPFDPQCCDLKELIAQQILPDMNVLNRQINMKCIGLPHEVRIDQRLIRHVVTNLLENALKYSEGKRDPELTLMFDDEFVQIKIQDFGIGIPEEDKPRLFDTFFRASNVDNIQGTGLGLSIVKDYIKMHQGNIKFSSKLNEGTTFTILLPKLIMNEL